MEKLLRTPLLPENKITTAVVSSEYPQVIKALTENCGIKIIPVNNNKNLEQSISSHADCMIVQLDQSTVIIDKCNYNHFVNYLTNIGDFTKEFKLIPTTYDIKSPYPHDVRLNVKVIGNKIIANTPYVDETVIYHAQRNNFKFIHCNQGYSACSTVVLNNKALITDDESIYCAAISNEIDSLKISKGSIKLKGQNYGFIGGTCGMIDKNLIAFTGKLSSHTDADLIIDFLIKHNVNYVELTNEPLTDIGGIIPIFESV